MDFFYLLLYHLITIYMCIYTSISSNNCIQYVCLHLTLSSKYSLHFVFDSLWGSPCYSQVMLVHRNLHALKRPDIAVYVLNHSYLGCDSITRENSGEKLCSDKGKRTQSTELFKGIPSFPHCYLSGHKSLTVRPNWAYMSWLSGRVQICAPSQRGNNWACCRSSSPFEFQHGIFMQLCSLLFGVIKQSNKMNMAGNLY